LDTSGKRSEVDGKLYFAVIARLFTSCAGSILKHIIEGNIEGSLEVKENMDEGICSFRIKKTRGYWKMNEETGDRNRWRNLWEGTMDLT
jgi:hypothetical protein